MGALLLLPLSSLAADSAVFSTDAGAIRGYDAVAYFTQGRAVRGDPDISHSWNGAVWHFSSDENRADFASAPERYAPAYGGYCAYAVANGYTATTDPEAWSIVDGRLFLNFSQGIKRRWEGNTRGHISSGDANWPAVLSR
jgi:hypothetical protein